MTRPDPGTALAMPSRAGNIVLVVTFFDSNLGHLVWVAGPVYDKLPTVDQVTQIRDWRWPLFFPAGSAIRRKIAVTVGKIGLPDGLSAVPRMRGGSRELGWKEVEILGAGELRIIGDATDPDLPILSTVNDTALVEMVETDWRPRDDW